MPGMPMSTKADAFLAVMDRFNCCGFNQPAYAHKHSFSQAKNPLMNLGIAELGRESQRENRFKAEKQLLEVGVILPGWQLCGFEAIGELLIGHKSLFRFVRA
jgi:hypothetical protein